MDHTIDIKIFLRLSSGLKYLTNNLFRLHNLREKLNIQGIMIKKKTYDHFSIMECHCEEDIWKDVPKFMKDLRKDCFSIKRQTRSTRGRSRASRKHHTKKKKKKAHKERLLIHPLNLEHPNSILQSTSSFSEEYKKNPYISRSINKEVETIDLTHSESRKRKRNDNSDEGSIRKRRKIDNQLSSLSFEKASEIIKKYGDEYNLVKK